MHVCVCHIFYINLFLSFIYEYIFTKFAENFYGYESKSAKKKKKKKIVLIFKQHGGHSRLFENH